MHDTTTPPTTPEDEHGTQLTLSAKQTRFLQIAIAAAVYDLNNRDLPTLPDITQEQRAQLAYDLGTISLQIFRQPPAAPSRN